MLWLGWPGPSHAEVCGLRAFRRVEAADDDAMTTRYFGAPIARNEDRRLLTGRALFVNDVERPGMLHVAFLRSPHAHARLGAVDLRGGSVAGPGAARRGRRLRRR